MRIDSINAALNAISTSPLADAQDALLDTIGAMLEAFDGSDARMPNRAASAPGDFASAAPDVSDLNGTVIEWSPQALAAQRHAAGMLSVGSSSLHNEPAADIAADRAWDGSMTTDAGSVAPTQTAHTTAPSAAPLFGGDVRDGQAYGVIGSPVFNAAMRW
jgi:hypothetical protein